MTLRLFWADFQRDLFLNLPAGPPIKILTNVGKLVELLATIFVLIRTSDHDVRKGFENSLPDVTEYLSLWNYGSRDMSFSL